MARNDTYDAYRYNEALRKAYKVAYWALHGWALTNDEDFLYVINHVPLPTKEAAKAVARALAALRWKNWEFYYIDSPKIDAEKVTVEVGRYGQLVYSAYIDGKEEVIYKNNTRSLRVIIDGDQLKWEEQNAAPRDWARCLAALVAVNEWRESLVDELPEEITGTYEFKVYWNDRGWAGSILVGPGSSE